jgi:ankyrin repeat protein
MYNRKHDAEKFIQTLQRSLPPECQMLPPDCKNLDHIEVARLVSRSMRPYDPVRLIRLEAQVYAYRIVTQSYPMMLDIGMFSKDQVQGFLKIAKQTNACLRLAKLMFTMTHSAVKDDGADDDRPTLGDMIGHEDKLREELTDAATKALDHDDEEAVERFVNSFAGKPRVAPSPRSFALFEHIDRGDMDTVRQILHDDPRLVHAEDPEGRTALYHAAIRNDPDLIRYCADLGGDVNHSCCDYWTPVFEAAAAGLLDALVVLHELGADINVMTPLRWTPLTVAITRGSYEVAGTLVNMGADVLVKTGAGASAAMLAEIMGVPIHLLDKIHAKVRKHLAIAQRQARVT